MSRALVIPAPYDDRIDADSNTFSHRLQRHHAVGRWSAANENQSWTPRPRSVPTLWRYPELRSFALESAQFVKGEDAALRVITLLNPGHTDHEAAVGYLYSGLQILNPGETMTAHRHAASAIRFVLEGEGGWTAVDGDRISVHPGDVVVTPSRLWHEHGSDADSGVVIWQDCTNDPLVNTLAANFFELHPQGSHLASSRRVDTLALYGNLLLPDQRQHADTSPLLSYPWDKCCEALHNAAQAGLHSPFDGVIMEYTNPSTGGAVTHTIGAHLQLLHPGEQTCQHRHTGSVMYVAAEGNGTTTIDDIDYEWMAGDSFCVPSWSWHRHTNRSTTSGAVLFSYNEFPLMHRLGLYAEELTGPDAARPA